MIKLFSSTDKIYNSNGDKVITPLKAKVHKGDNENYFSDFRKWVTFLPEPVILYSKVDSQKL